VMCVRVCVREIGSETWHMHYLRRKRERVGGSLRQPTSAYVSLRQHTYALPELKERLCRWEHHSRCPPSAAVCDDVAESETAREHERKSVREREREREEGREGGREVGRGIGRERRCSCSISIPSTSSNSYLKQLHLRPHTPPSACATRHESP
jgi:hypothetical protein